MILGIRAHDFGKQTPEFLAERISEKGFSCIQLALSKAISGLNDEPGFLNPGLAHYIREVFYRKNIQIAVLGCYINPIYSDLEQRKKGISRFKEHIRFARDFGTSIVATETGFVPLNDPIVRESNFEILVETVAELVSEAEKFGVMVGIEGGHDCTISSPVWMKRLLDTVDSNNLQVVFDPMNLVPEEDYTLQDDMMLQSFELFGDRIVSLHAKDFLIENGKKSVIDNIGQGLLNYDLLFNLIKEKKPYVNITMEGTSPSTIDSSIKFLRDTFKKANPLPFSEF